MAPMGKFAFALRIVRKDAVGTQDADRLPGLPLQGARRSLEHFLGRRGQHGSPAALVGFEELQFVAAHRILQTVSARAGSSLSERGSGRA